jgi:hypothetical protein
LTRLVNERGATLAGCVADETSHPSAATHRPAKVARVTSWQGRILEGLRLIPGVEVEPYGSVVEHQTLDPWSDLDVRLRLSVPASAETLFGAPLWAWQESLDDGGQHLRLVFSDGRRVDVVVNGRHHMALPDPPRDNAVRFEAALAASRLGRGSNLVGLHLVLGILRAALVQMMLIADRDTGTNHRRFGTEHDARAAEAAAIAAGRLRPETALEACELYGQWRKELEPTYRADWSGLQQVLDRGQSDRR